MTGFKQFLTIPSSDARRAPVEVNLPTIVVARGVCSAPPDRRAVETPRHPTPLPLRIRSPEKEILVVQVILRDGSQRERFVNSKALMAGTRCNIAPNFKVAPSVHRRIFARDARATFAK